MKQKLIRITTVPISLEKLLENQLGFMSAYYEVIAVSADEARLKRYGEKAGVRTRFVNLTRTISPIADLKALWKMYWFLRAERPFIVHSHTPKAGTIGMLAAFLARVPHRLHTVAGLPLLETGGNKRRLLNAVERITYACATRVYPNSEGLRRIIVNERLADTGKLQVIGSGSSNGINTSYFDPARYSLAEREALKSSLNLEPANLVFIFVGRLVGDKGINELIAAFKRLQAEKSGVSLLLVGEQEPELDPLSPETIVEIQNNRDIVSTGYQADVRPYFAISDFLVFPSYREGFPNVVMQAGAMGLPSLVSDINGCNEIVIEGTNGVLMPVKNADAVLAGMLRFVEDARLVREMKANARMMIVERYAQQNVWESILAEYKGLENNDV